MRLESGMRNLDVPAAQRSRYLSRKLAILNTLAYLDELHDCKDAEMEKRIFGRPLRYDHQTKHPA